MTEVASLMEGERSCYRGGQFNGGRMMLQRCTVSSRENGHVTDGWMNGVLGHFYAL